MPNETDSGTDNQDKGRTDGGEGQDGGDAALDPKTAAAVNKLFSSRFGRELKKFEGNLGKVIGEHLAAAGFSKPAPKPDEDDEDGEREGREEARTQGKTGKVPEGKGKGQERAGDGGDAGKGGSTESSELETIKAELAKNRREMDRMKRDTAEKERVAVEKEAFSDVKSRLTGKVRPEALDTVMKLLRADGRIAIEKDGSVLFVDGDEQLDLDEGIERWLKSSEGSMFVPAPGGRQGNLGGPNRRPSAKPVPRVGNAGGNLTPAQRTAQRFSKLGLLS